MSGPETSLIISPMDFGRFFMKPSGFWRTLVGCLPSRVDSCKCLSKAEWILANPFKSRVNSRKPFIQSRVDSRKPLQKPSEFSQTFYPKPSGFSQMFIKSRVDSRRCLPSRLDSRKSCAKPSRFWRNLLRNQVDFRQAFITQTDSLQVFLLSKSLIPRNVIQKCYQSSIFQVAGPTKAVFTSIFSRPQCFSYVGHYPSEGN